MFRRVLTAAVLLLLTSLPLHAGNYIVRNTDDAGSHTLRWAILQANATAGTDIITFDIPGEGPHVLIPASPLPPLTDAAGVIIDGLSQNGSGIGSNPPATMQLRIVLSGAMAGDAPGIWILSPNNQVTGLVIHSFAEDGIRIQGIKQGTSRNTVRHCIIGLDTDGTTPRPNGTGTRNEQSAGVTHWAGISLISLQHSPGLVQDNMIFGNVISGNNGDGILLADCMGGRVFSNTLSSNHIGAVTTGDAVAGNTRDGVLLYGGSYGNTISGNLVVGNGSDGIHLVGDQSRNAQTHHNTIRKNVIGISLSNIPLGNALDGINLGGAEYEYDGGFASNNSITANTIAANGRSGVGISEHPSPVPNADGNRISQNAIFANASIGIDLREAPSPDGSVTGTPNNNLAAPLILEAEYGRGVATVRGAVEAHGTREMLSVELYKCNSSPSGKCQGPIYLGTSVPDPEGVWLFSTNGLLEAGDSVVAVLIDAKGNTSEFAQRQPVKLMRFDDLPQMTDLYIGKSSAGASAQFVALKTTDEVKQTAITVDVVKDCWGILEVYTDNGELVTTLVNRWLPKGTYDITWDGLNWRGSQVPAGTYICRLDADGIRQTTTVNVPASSTTTSEK
ncbi:MAG: right-handed parallel beta-helix repeat-containing protein [Bacteroidetes bacterium]|nr:right-handed parallel beta-helix repeat-containing protein [Bacteroidota bacterium]